MPKSPFVHLWVRPPVGIFFFFLKKLVSSVESFRVSPVAFLAHIFWKLDYPLLGTCFDLLSDTIIVSYDLHYSLTSVEPLAAWPFTRVGSMS